MRNLILTKFAHRLILRIFLTGFIGPFTDLLRIEVFPGDELLPGERSTGEDSRTALFTRVF